MFAGETVDGEQATVRTRLVSKGGIEIPVDYRLHRVGDRWLVYDVTIEGVSLVANYRAQFNKIIQTSSFAGPRREAQGQEGGGPGPTPICRSARRQK